MRNKAMCLLALLVANVALADSPEPVREIFVPFEDLNVILENDKHRVFLTRQEYEALLKEAKAKPQTPAPHKVVLVAAQYDGRLEEGRALIAGELTVEVLEEGLFALPLELGGVGIRSATLDGQPAPLTIDANLQASVLVKGRGTHQLALQLTAPLSTAAAQQTLQVTLPTNAAARLSLSVPGNVEVKGGAAVVNREFDMAAGRTTLELVPQRGGMAIALSLNNRLQQDRQVIVARSVIVDEMTQGYERIHATISYRVLHGAVEKLRIAVPAGFEVTKVDSPLLARWEEKPGEQDQKTLELALREPTSEQIVLHVTANRSPVAGADWLASIANWKFPRLVPLDTAGQVAVIGLLVEDRLQPEQIATSGLLPIDSAALAGAIPASVLQAEPGAPTIRQVVSYYAPTSDYSLSATFARPPAELKVAANSLLVIGDQRLTLQGGFALTPEAEELFALRFVAPTGWQVTQVTLADGTPLAIERYEAEAGATRIVVRLPKGIGVGRTQTINFQAIHVPAGWLSNWAEQSITFPRLLVEGATTMTGAIAAQTLDDLTVRPGELAGLTPLLDNEKAAFGLGGLPTTLAYRYESPEFSAGLIVERTEPSLVAKAFSFFKVQPGNIVTHYELHYDVREARARTLVFSLDKRTPSEITVTGLDGIVVKEYSLNDDGPLRRWTVQLAERRIGSVKIAVDFEQRYEGLALEQFALPLVQAEDVDYQSALVAVEGDAELDTSVSTTARPVDVGELAAARYVAGKRLIGAWGYVGARPPATIDVERRDPYALPAALVQRAELVTKISGAGRAQSVARYDVVTKATLLEIRLPPESTLWTIYLDDQPTKPQRELDSLLLSLPAQERVAVRKLQIVYETPSQRLGLAETVSAVAPALLVRAAGSDAEREIPQADLEWQLVLPTGYAVRGSGGTVFTQELEDRELAAIKVARWLYDWSGGIRPWGVMAVRESARRALVSDNLRQFERSAEPYGSTSATPPADSAPPPLAAMPSAVEAPPPPEPAPLAAANEPTREADMPRRPMLRDGQEDGAQQQQAGGQPATASPQPADEPAEQAKGKYWALEGVSSLKIEIDSNSGPATTFRSLGADPVLEATIVDRRRLDAAACGIALLVFLVGVGLTRRAPREKAAYVLIVLLVATAPLLLTTRFDEVAQVFDYAFYAGCALVPWYLAAAPALWLYRWLARRMPADLRRTIWVKQVAAILLAVGLGLTGAVAAAHEGDDDDKIPVTVPADAIIVPYDPEKPADRAAQDKILVPYARYVELWNAAHPDKPIDTTPPPVGYAIAGAAYEAMLGSGDFLSLTGRMQIDVYGDKPVAVPLHLAGGVLERATVDGQPARLQVVEPAKPTSNQQAAAPNAGLPPRLLLLHLSGKGRKSVVLQVRLGLARQGGWRIVRGQLPVGAAAALTLTVPDAGTEVRQSGLPDKAEFTAEADNAKIETSLAAGGSLDLRWRPQVAEGMVDQALTARSTAVLDVREDALRLVWQVQLEFGRASRDAFTFTAPADYLVEQVTGDNVRGWEAKADPAENAAGRQRIDVTLLKPAVGSTTLTLHLSRRGRVGAGDLAEFDAPAILVRDAALEQGVIAVRRSPRLELRTLGAVGLSRADSSGQTQAVEQIADAADAAVLVVKPYQAFRFVKPPFRLTLAAAEMPQLATAEVRAALRVAERDTTLDAAVTFRPQGQPLYRVRMYLPAGFELERLGPGDLEWAITTENDRQLLTVHLLDGRSEPFTLTLLGKIETPAAPMPPAPAIEQPAPRNLPVPKLEIVGVEKQEGEIVILPDPDTDVRLDNVANAETSPLTGGPGWMKGEQQPLAKAVLRYRAANYAATLTLTPRTPLVRVRTISNVKVTPQAIEETVLLNFRIEQAGIHRLSFLVPQHLARGRLKALLLKQKLVEQATAADGTPVEGFVRIRLELQDYVRGDYSVLLEHDRLLAADKQTVQLPIVETGRTDQRLVALENAGRDELVVDPDDVLGLAPVNRQEQAWRDLAAVLGDGVTQAYAAIDGQPRPSLAFQTVQRSEVAKAGARIGLAETLLVVDAAGAYRGLAQFRVTNATEQFLEVTLPLDARLWTAFVAGEPVKPAEATPPMAGVARIPLLKTAAGEGDYLVELKYGGRMRALGGAGSIGASAVSFPLIQTNNIHVELSQVRLLLAESRSWFDFGGTMRLVEGEGELAAGFQAYLGKRIQEAAEALASGTSDYTRVRAMVNLKQSQSMLESSRRSGGATESHFAANAALLDQAERQVQEELAQQREETFDNRGRLNLFYEQQDVQRSKNVVSDLGSNFDVDGTVNGRDQGGVVLNPDFLHQNSLDTKSGLKAGETARPDAPAAATEGKLQGRYLRGGKPTADDAVQQQGQAQPAQKAPAIADKRELDELSKKLDATKQFEEAKDRAGGERAEQLERYQQNLERKSREFGYRQSDAYGVQPNGTQTFGDQSGMGGYGGGLPQSRSGSAAPGYDAPANAPAGGPLFANPMAQPGQPEAAFDDSESISQVAAGLASLDVRLPERGRLYSFTTPRGDIEITARSVPQKLWNKLIGLAALLAALFVVGLASRPASRRLVSRLLDSTVFGILLAVTGFLSLVLGILPLAGLLLIGVGIGLAIRSRLTHPALAH